MQVTLNAKSTRTVKNIVALLIEVSDLGSRISHSDATAISLEKYWDELAARHPGPARIIEEEG